MDDPVNTVVRRLDGIVEQVCLSQLNQDDNLSRLVVEGGGSLLLVIIHIVQAIWRRDLLLHMPSFTQASHFYWHVHRTLVHTLARLLEILPVWITDPALDSMLLLLYRSTFLRPVVILQRIPSTTTLSRITLFTGSPIP